MRSISTTTALALAAAGAKTALAHGHVESINVNGVSYPGYQPWGELTPETVGWKTSTQNEGPVQMSALQSADVICSHDAENAQASVPIDAGTTFSVVYKGGQNGFEHPGYQAVYLAPCGSGGCGSVDKSTLKFFKIQEAGLLQGGEPDEPTWNSQKWATTEVHKSATGTWTDTLDTFTVTIPSSIAPGSYVMRHEIAGLHMAHQGNAEIYPQCINVEISGSGTDQPEGVLATALYTSDHPGFAMNVWQNLDSYQIPGPAVAVLGGGSGAGTGNGNTNEDTEDPETTIPDDNDNGAVTPTPGNGEDEEEVEEPVTTAPGNGEDEDEDEVEEPVTPAPGNGNGNNNGNGNQPPSTFTTSLRTPTPTGGASNPGEGTGSDDGEGEGEGTGEEPTDECSGRRWRWRCRNKWGN